MASDPEVDAHNRRLLWEDITNRLDVAVDSIEQAQASLEDLATYGVAFGPEWAEQLDPMRDAVRRAANEAREASGP
jgi:hypothetical protein